MCQQPCAKNIQILFLHSRTLLVSTYFFAKYKMNLIDRIAQSIKLISATFQEHRRVYLTTLS